MKKLFHGFRLGGLTLLSFDIQRGARRRVTFGSWHNPKHMCWLWYFEAHQLTGEGKGFRAYHTSGAQARWGLKLGVFGIAFCWQAEGWYSNPEEWRNARCA